MAMVFQFLNRFMGNLRGCEKWLLVSPCEPRRQPQSTEVPHPQRTQCRQVLGAFVLAGAGFWVRWEA